MGELTQPLQRLLEIKRCLKNEIGKKHFVFANSEDSVQHMRLVKPGNKESKYPIISKYSGN